MDRSDEPQTVAGLIRDLGQRQASCPEHGPYTSTGKLLLRREVWSQCPACADAAAKSRADAEAREQAERLAAKRLAAIGQACIPTRFQTMTFDAYKADTPEQRAALARVRDYVENFRDHKRTGAGLVMAGLPGTGKTHLAAAACLALIGQHWVHYTTCMGLIRMVRDTWRRDSERTERDVLKLLGETIDLLVIDEIGVQYGTDGEQTILFEVLDRRYAEMRPTLLLTNQDKAGFKAFIGERVADRLTQTHSWMAFDWPSYRRAAREAA